MEKKDQAVSIEAHLDLARRLIVFALSCLIIFLLCGAIAATHDWLYPGEYEAYLRAAYPSWMLPMSIIALWAFAALCVGMAYTVWRQK